MTAALSRRVGRVWSMPAISDLDYDATTALHRDIEMSGSFDAMTSEHQQIILQAEEEFADGDQEYLDRIRAWYDISQKRELEHMARYPHIFRRLDAVGESDVRLRHDHQDE